MLEVALHHATPFDAFLSHQSLTQMAEKESYSMGRDFSISFNALDLPRAMRHCLISGSMMNNDNHAVDW